MKRKDTNTRRALNVNRVKMLLMAVFMIAAIFMQTAACFADGAGPERAGISVGVADNSKAFELERLMNLSKTGYVDFDKDLHIIYQVECKAYPEVNSYDYKVIKTVEGTAVIPSGTIKSSVDMTALIDEMNGQLDNYAFIYLELSIKEVDNNGSGISTNNICLQNTQKVMDTLPATQGMGNQNQNPAPAQTAPAERSYKGASSWALAELDKAAQYGFITDKIKDNMGGSITREEFAELAVKVYEEYTGKTVEYTDMNAFIDTKNPEIFKAYKLGIVNGTDMAKKLFSPKALTNREQVAAMMYRLVKAIQPDTDFSTAGTESFADAKQISSWALDSVKFMNKNGIIKGTAGKFDPKGTCTREMAVIIGLRSYEKYSDVADNTPASSIGTDTNDNTLPQVNIGTTLPADFPKDIPMLPITEIMTVDGFGSDLDASIIYLTDTGFEKAIMFYSDKANYKNYQSTMPGDEAGDMSKSFIVTTGDYNILAVIQQEEGQVQIMLHVFGLGFSD